MNSSGLPALSNSNQNSDSNSNSQSLFPDSNSNPPPDYLSRIASFPLAILILVAVIYSLILFAFPSPSGANDIIPLPSVCRIVQAGPLVVGTSVIYDATLSTYASQGGFNGSCSIPSNSIAIFASIVAVRPYGPGYISVWAHGTPEPTSGTVLNFWTAIDPVGGPAYPPAPGRLAIIPLDTDGKFWVETYWYGTDILVIDAQAAVVPE